MSLEKRWGDKERGACLYDCIGNGHVDAITSLAIDIGFWYVHKNNIRQVAEAAALAGSAFMPDKTAAEAAATKVELQTELPMRERVRPRTIT